MPGVDFQVLRERITMRDVLQQLQFKEVQFPRFPPRTSC